MRKEQTRWEGKVQAKLGDAVENRRRSPVYFGETARRTRGLRGFADLPGSRHVKELGIDMAGGAGTVAHQHQT
jgi:hypothetical protein